MSRARWLLSGVVSAVLASALRASADEPTATVPAAAPPSEAAPPTTPAGTIDVVILRSGAHVRGRVAELVPDDHVTLVLETGESRRVAWSEVDRVTLGWSGAGPPPGAAPAQSADGAILVVPPPPPPMIGPRTRVHVSSPRRVSLYRRSSDGGRWVHACASPCDVELPLGDTYRVQGTGVNASSSFRLQGSAATTTLTVAPSSTLGEVFGGALTTIGGISAFVGLLLLPSKDSRGVGAASAIIGSGLVAGGILVFRSAAKTDVSQRASEAQNATASGLLDAFLREPTWRAQTPDVAAAGVASPASLPVLLDGSF